MEEIKVYNTLTKEKEVFKPITPGEVKIYVCGVTPYNHPHIGNARPAVTWDIIRRYLEYIGYKVKFVQNFTDVDDKIINKANAEGTDWKTISDRYIDAYFKVMDALHVRRADVYPRVSDHMDDIIHMVEELIKKADIALYSAKCAGKNRIEFYDDNVESTSYKRLDLEKNMRNATRNAFSEFEVYFQPIVNITKEGNPCAGAEALIRWNSGVLGLIPRTDFIPLAEYLGLINPIGEFVLREACIHCKYWNDMGHPEYKVNVNLSVVQLLQNDIVERIAHVIEETRITPQNLTLEVTESLAVNDMSRMKRILADIRHLGVRVALDDFGTGYSSLNHIREMPIDVIKIDRCFIIDIGKDDFSNAFVKMVGELATAIHVNVCVEGVETKEQLDALMGSKVQLIQGFYFGKPMKAEMFERQFL